MNEIFLNLGFALLAATGFALLAKKFKQPLLIGYLCAGVAVSLLGFFQAEETRSTFEILSHFGHAFLLFLIGLELRFTEIKTYGRIAVYTGVGQIVFTSLIGFFLVKLLGFSVLESIYISIALTFSSTVIVVKLLTEKRDMDSLYGRIAIGFLLVQDAVAILALIFVSSLGKEGFSFGSLLTVITNSAFIIIALIAASKTVIPFVIHRAAKSLEILFILAVAWAFLMASLASFLGLSAEIGAFLAGVSLANLDEEPQIAAKVKPLRDLFIVFFFLVLGLQMSFANFFTILIPALVLSLFILVGNPLIVMVIMGRLGFRKRTSFFASITVAQISEFSLILISLGLLEGHLDRDIVSMITLIGIITIAGSSYMILNSSKLYKRFSKYLNIFERRERIEEIFFDDVVLDDHVVLVGCGRLGSEILKKLKSKGDKVVIVDFNPKTISWLKSDGFQVLFGDITDPDIMEKANLDKAKMVIVTIFDPEETTEFLKEVKGKIHCPVITTAATSEWALNFYKNGSDYVIVPRILSGQQVAKLITDQRIEELKSGELKEKHLSELSLHLRSESI